MTKIIPLSRIELMRGGGDSITHLPSDVSTEELLMCAKAEEQFLYDERSKYTNDFVVELDNAKTKMQRREIRLVFEKRKFKTKRRISAIRDEVDRRTNFKELFFKRAQKILPPEAFDMIFRAAQIDSREIEEAMVVDDDAPATSGKKIRGS